MKFSRNQAWSKSNSQILIKNILPTESNAIFMHINFKFEMTAIEKIFNEKISDFYFFSLSILFTKFMRSRTLHPSKGKFYYF